MVAALPVSLLIIVVGLVVAAAGTVLLAGYTIMVSERDRTREAFTLLLVTAFVWTAGQGGRLLTPSLGGKLLWQSVLYVGVVATPVAWLAFSLLYTGRHRLVRRETVAVLLLEPVVTLALLYTNAQHGLFYDTVDLTYAGSTPLLTTSAGPYWWVHFAYSYVLVGVGIILLVRFALTAERLYRFQTGALLFSGLLPLVANAVTISGVGSATVVDLTPLVFTLSTFALFGAMFYSQFLDIKPVARDVVVDRLDDGIVVVDGEWRIVSANPAAKRLLTKHGDTTSLIGKDLSSVEPTLAVTPDEMPTGATAGLSRGFEAARTVDGDTTWFWIRRVDLSAETDKDGFVVTVTDLTDKKRFERQLRQLHRTNQRLLVAEDEQHIADIAVDSAKQVLDLPITGIWKHDPDRATLEPLGMTDAALDVLGEQPTLDADSSLAWQAFAEGELQTFTDLRERPDAFNPRTPIESEVQLPIGKWGVMTSGSTARTEFEDIDFDLLRLLGATIERSLARQDRERRIQHLQRKTSAIVRAETTQEIARTAVETADEVLDLPLSGIHLRSDDGTVLEGTAATRPVRETFDGPPSYRRDGATSIDEVVWEVFETDETLVVDDIRATDGIELDSPVRSVIIHSLGDHGVFITSSMDPDAFDRTDRALAELFATTVTAALDRVAREQELRKREQELRRQNERLEEFTSVVSHDLRSPLNQVNVMLEQVAAEYDDERIDLAVDATERAERMVDDLLRLARQGRTVEETHSEPLAETLRAAWQSVSTGDATLEIADGIGAVRADHARLRQAFENLFRNAVEHGSTSPDSHTRQDAVEHGSTSPDSHTRQDTAEHSGLTVRVGRLDDTGGLYVADNGPGIPTDQRDSVFDHGVSTTESGTGFGLAIVKRIVEAHGWEIRIRESVDGGARFELVGPSIDSSRPDDSRSD